ncbi:MAG: hypothetical protein GC154_13290 [bacterium]|nr:hypothetical protein [bacterium]
MGRIIKAPDIKIERNYNIVEREKVLRHAEDEAAELIDAVRTEADRIREEALQEAESMREASAAELESMRAELETENAEIREQQRQQGHQEGLNQGLEDARKQVAGLIADFKKMIAEGQRIYEGMFRDQEPEIRQLVCDVIARVLQQKIETDDEIVVRIARECLNQTADRKTVRILVNPEDKQKIEEWVPEFLSHFDDLEKIEVAVDPRVGRAGVMIESPSGGVDGRVDKQVDILTDAILEE